MSKRKRAAPAKSKSNKKQKTEHYEWPVVIVENSPFELVELTEIILSHLIVKDPISVLNIAKTSNRNNDLIRSRKFWDKFGYNLLTEEDPVPIDIIKVLLSQFRLEQLKKQMYLIQSEVLTLLKRVTLPQPMLDIIDTMVPRPPQSSALIDSRAYLAYHTHFTAEACTLLFKLQSIIGIDFFQITDFVSLIECSKEAVKQRESTSAVDWCAFNSLVGFGFSQPVHCEINSFMKNKPFLDFHLLYQVRNAFVGRGVYVQFQIWKKFLPKNRSVLLILGNISMQEEENFYDDENNFYNKFSFFLKYDASSGIIEECCSFADYVQRNFPARPADTWKKVMCAVSEYKSFDVNKFPSRNFISMVAENANREPILYRNVKLRK